MIDVAKFFEDHEDDDLSFADIPPERRLHHQPDLNAMLLLSRLCPGTEGILGCPDSDAVYFKVGPESVEHATEEELLDLMRCKVQCDGEDFFIFY